MHGYKWELSPDDHHFKNDIDVAPVENVFTFRDCIEGIFNGGKVRVTDETPRRVSVYDVIRLIIGEDANPHKAFERFCKNVPEVLARCYNFSFPGIGQRPTPVTDSEGVMLIVNALPGVRARQFRMGAANILTRFLAGDQTLHDEINENASRQTALHEDHPLQMLTDELYVNPKSSQYIMHSPVMKGKHVAEFYYKPVVYLLNFSYNNKDYIKVGWSTDFKQRIHDHNNELPGCTIYSIIAVSDPMIIEKKWKASFSAYNHTVNINGCNKTELFTGISNEEGEQYILTLCEEYNLQNMQNRELEKYRLEVERDRERYEFEKIRMVHELEMKKMELQILQLRAAEHG